MRSESLISSMYGLGEPSVSFVLILLVLCRQASFGTAFRQVFFFLCYERGGGCLRTPRTILHKAWNPP